MLNDIRWHSAVDLKRYLIIHYSFVLIIILSGKFTIDVLSIFIRIICFCVEIIVYNIAQKYIHIKTRYNSCLHTNRLGTVDDMFRPTANCWNMDSIKILSSAISIYLFPVSNTLLHMLSTIHYLRYYTFLPSLDLDYIKHIFIECLHTTNFLEFILILTRALKENLKEKLWILCHL